ncbi:hypothetical protein TL16_g10672 [Triparma laevis f. inornata]|uniref:Uncharacterized protein n=1 Tax=Triparma laevis f. inornata TaxID=1714386 RepID=A0A9W7BA22_9STRA|nr:hypothetical protein TL16_g10672 [Triparma laevis f. inornata]
MEALGKLMDGGVPLEHLTIGISFAQNFGMVSALERPLQFKKWFEWIEALGWTLGCSGEWGGGILIALGLFLAWLIYDFDAGLYRERAYFGFYWMGDKGILFSSSSMGKTFDSKSKAFKFGRAGFTSAGLGSITLIVLFFSSIAAGWIENNLFGAFILVLSGLSFLSFLHQEYLWRETGIADSANEDFAKIRQGNQMFFFLFSYTVAYLSGVSACTRLLVAEATVEKLFGGFLLLCYVFVPLWRLRGSAVSVKAAVNEVADGQSYKDCLDVFRREALESKINDVTSIEGVNGNGYLPSARYLYRLSRDTPGTGSSTGSGRSS